MVHAAAGRMVRRQTNQIVDSVRTLAADLASALQEVHRLADVQRGADERQLHDVVGSLMDRVAILDSVADAVAQLEARVQMLEEMATRGS